MCRRTGQQKSVESLDLMLFFVCVPRKIDEQKEKLKKILLKAVTKERELR